MPPGSNEIHNLAQRYAISKGPRTFNIRGTDRKAYGITKKELRLIFHNNGYNTTTGSRWRTTIMEWLEPDLHNDLLTVDPTILPNKKETVEWAVIFSHLDRLDYINLKQKGENDELKVWPPQELWERAFSPY